ncbi:DUF3488 and transglutaminase-like domain-containing protein [Pseudogulbenkiania sp. MAI-1]|uniref:transglutaminase TgpA family protein n=1 Tax=Pseudogulbenkiania sp. MAI-1 TaxID=990370 RepID=UPI00045EC418|nr:DUF3488 and transglutaminase-like domain-containing protein [Pseudogulbenkiania sp. MAI-1]
MMGNDVLRRALPVLVALAITAAPLALYLPGWVAALSGAMLLARGVLLWQHRQLPPRWLVALALAVPLVLLWLSLRTLVGREGGSALLLLLVGFKTFETFGLRDWRVLLGLGFFLAATPLLFDQSPGAAAWLVLSLFCLTWAMAALHGKQPLLASLRTTLLALLLSLPLMLVLFVVMPRLPGPLWSMPAAGASASSGLSDDMAPGSISQLIPSNEPVFTAVFAGTPPAQRDFYWRVMLFDRFDGRRWFNAGAIAEPGGKVMGGVPVGYTLTVVPDKGRVPVLDLPGSVAEGLRERAGMVWQQQRVSDVRIRYRAASHAGALLAEPLDEVHQAFYRYLPAGNERTRALAAGIRARSRDDEAYIRAVLEHFRLESFRYTLSPPPLSGAVVDQFLFETRQGFCEHYASALAFLARAAGIPSRVIVGYQGGEYNPAGGFWQIRSSDAHAWVEVWLASRQAWWRIDPTAAVSPDRIERGVDQVVPGVRATVPMLGGRPPEWMLALRQYWQAANFNWQQWVVGYDAGRQRLLFRSLGLGQEVDVPAVLKGLLVGAVFMVMPFWWWWRRQPQREPLQVGWSLLGRRLRRVGVAVTPADTPAEVLHRAAGLAEADRAQLMALLDAYAGLRYRTTAEVSPRAARRWLREVRRFRPASVR